MTARRRLSAVAVLMLVTAACTSEEWTKVQTAAAVAYEAHQKQCLALGDDDAERRACVEQARKVWAPLIAALTVAPEVPGATKDKDDGQEEDQ